MHPLAISALINQYLFPKYGTFNRSGFRDFKALGDSDFSPEDQEKISDNLKALDILLDDNVLLLAMKMLLPFPNLEDLAPFQDNAWSLQQAFPEKDYTMLTQLGGMKNDKIHFDFGLYDDIQERLTNVRPNVPHNPNINMDQQRRELRNNMKVALFERLNETFKLGSQPLYTMPEDTEKAAEELALYLNTLHTFCDLELSKWSPEYVHKLTTLSKHYDFALAALNSDDTALYSGVSIAPYHIALTRTGREEKAEDRDFLKDIAKEHYSTHKEEMDAFKQVEDHLDTLRATFNWLENVIINYLRKDGHIS